MNLCNKSCGTRESSFLDGFIALSRVYDWSTWFDFYEDGLPTRMRSALLSAARKPTNTEVKLVWDEFVPGIGDFCIFDLLRYLYFRPFTFPVNLLLYLIFITVMIILVVYDYRK